MVTDTKNKRGRPPKHSAMYTVFPELEKRTAANMYFAMGFIKDVMGEKPGDKNNFFISEKGKIKRQGIAEQLGRMLEAELITIEQARELAQWAIDSYNAGDSVKHITSTLRLYRQNLAGTAKAEAQGDL